MQCARCISDSVYFSKCCRTTACPMRSHEQLLDRDIQRLRAHELLQWRGQGEEKVREECHRKQRTRPTLLRWGGVGWGCVQLPRPLHRACCALQSACAVCRDRLQQKHSHHHAVVAAECRGLIWAAWRGEGGGGRRRTTNPAGSEGGGGGRCGHEPALLSEDN